MTGVVALVPDLTGRTSPAAGEVGACHHTVGVELLESGGRARRAGSDLRLLTQASRAQRLERRLELLLGEFVVVAVEIDEVVDIATPGD